MTDDNTDAFLEHFGVKGMKWGVRREKHLNSLKRTAEGTGSFKDKYVAINSVSALDLFRGKGFQGALRMKISELEDRKTRTTEGKRIAGDVLSDLGLVGYANLGKKRK